MASLKHLKSPDWPRQSSSWRSWALCLARALTGLPAAEPRNASPFGIRSWHSCMTSACECSCRNEAGLLCHLQSRERKAGPAASHLRAFSPLHDTDPLDITLGRFRRVKSRLLKKKSKDAEKADASHLQEGKVGVASLSHLLPEGLIQLSHCRRRDAGAAQAGGFLEIPNGNYSTM